MSGRDATLLLQVRALSARLPAKALLPLAGMPAVVLAARRAANRGRPLIAATTTESSDDFLVETLESAGIETFRGATEDVLGRMASAVDGLPDDAVLVRLTADNFFPDGTLIEELLEAFRTCGAPYIRSGFDGSRLPYGLSVEAFTAAMLREADRCATDQGAREHVTPYMIGRHGGSLFQPRDLDRDLGHLRATIDNVDDYLRLQSLCRLVGSARVPRIGWRELCEALATLEPACPQVPRSRRGGRSLYALGTAQLGSPYGIANSAGLPSGTEAAAIVEGALRHGINVFDCARAYGSAETRLGRILSLSLASTVEIHTKLDPMDGADEASTRGELAARALTSVLRSCRELGVRTLNVLMLHRWAHRRLQGGCIWDSLLSLREEGLIGRLGASVYSPDEALEALADPDVEYVQIPFNLLDWRWRDRGVREAAARRPDVVVEARSVLLQGVIPSGPEIWPAVPRGQAEACCRQLDDLAATLGRRGRVDLCYAYVAGQPWIDSIVVGMESTGQLRENLPLFGAPPLSESELAIVDDTLPTISPALLDPATWPNKVSGRG